MLHIINSNLNARFPDDDSIRVRAAFLKAETTVLEELMPVENTDEVIKRIKQWEENIRQTVKRLRSGTEPAFGRIDHATGRNRKDSWRSVPKRITLAFSEEVQKELEEISVSEEEKQNKNTIGEAEAAK